jgi:hypothetical protein
MIDYIGLHDLMQHENMKFSCTCWKNSIYGFIDFWILRVFSKKIAKLIVFTLRKQKFPQLSLFFWKNEKKKLEK